MEFEHVRTDCRHFIGAVPCAPHKLHGVHCVEKDGSACRFYEPTRQTILIIKLGAAGDVIRTTPLLRGIRRVYPNAFVMWLTKFPELVPKRSDSSPGADRVLEWSSESLQTIRQTPYDIVINLDKDFEAGALAGECKAKSLQGYTLYNGKPYPANEGARHKYLTGIFDDISKANTKNYVQEIFEIAELPYQTDEYVLADFDVTGFVHGRKGGPVIGFNTGCGGRWPSRLWSEAHWAELTRTFLAKGVDVVLLGGPEEVERNERLQKSTGARYYGVRPLEEFIGIMASCDVIVTSITMALHLAIGLRKQVVALNNIFNKHEFELYGRGEIVEPSRPCTCFYSPRCANPEYHCIEFISVPAVTDAIERRLQQIQTH